MGIEVDEAYTIKGLFFLVEVDRYEATIEYHKMVGMKDKNGIN